MNLFNASITSPVQTTAFDVFRNSIFFLKADFPLSDQQLQDAIARKKSGITSREVKEIFFDKLHTLPERVIPITALTTLHILYKIITHKKNYFLKVNAFPDIYQEVSFFQEHWITQQLKSLGLPYVPIVTIDTSREKFPFDFMIMEEAKGYMLHNQQFSQMQEKDIFCAIGKYIARIHTIKTKSFGLFLMNEMIQNSKAIGMCSSWIDYIQLNVLGHIHTCLEAGLIDKVTRDCIEKIFLRKCEFLDTIHPVLLHNDLGAYNIFFADGKIQAVIDWEDAISGDPIYDIANFGTFNYRSEHMQRIDYFLDGYTKLHTLPEDFKQKYWLYYLRISVMKAALNSRYGKKDTSGRIHKSLENLKHFL